MLLPVNCGGSNVKPSLSASRLCRASRSADAFDSLLSFMSTRDRGKQSGDLAWVLEKRGRGGGQRYFDSEDTSGEVSHVRACSVAI